MAHFERHAQRSMVKKRQAGILDPLEPVITVLPDPLTQETSDPLSTILPTILPTTGDIPSSIVIIPSTVETTARSSSQPPASPSSSSPSPPPPSSLSSPFASSSSLQTSSSTNLPSSSSTSQSPESSSPSTASSPAFPPSQFAYSSTTAPHSASGGPASLSTAPPPQTFFSNKGATAALFTVLSLILVGVIGLLAFRFHKTMKRRRAEQESAEAARVATGVRLDLGGDDDDYAPYGMVQRPGGPVMAERSPSGSTAYHPFSDYAGEPVSELRSTEGSQPSESVHSVESHASSGAALLSQPSMGSASSSSRRSQPTSAKSRAHTAASNPFVPPLPDSAAVVPARYRGRANTTHSRTKSADRSTEGLARSHSLSFSTHTIIPPSRPLSGAFTSSSSGFTAEPSPSWDAMPFPDPPRLPAKFGELDPMTEDEAEVVRTSQVSDLGDDKDYHASFGRVLQVANR